MTIDLAIIPADRLAMLDTATLFHGSHAGGGGDPDCKHCARELLYEIVTGKHADQTPPGCTFLVAILPRLNDGPWRDDVHRTAVMRPYLRKFLVLDPANDQQRIYAIIDHVYRTALPSVCDVLKLDTYGSALRNLAPIVDHATAQAGRDLWVEMLPGALREKTLRQGEDAYDDAAARAAATTITAADAAYATAAAIAYDAAYAAAAVSYDAAATYDSAAARIAATAADVATRTAADAATATATATAGHLVLRGLCLEARQEAWAKAVTTILDRICAIP